MATPDGKYENCATAFTNEIRNLITGQFIGPALRAIGVVCLCV